VPGFVKRYLFFWFKDNKCQILQSGDPWLPRREVAAIRCLAWTGFPLLLLISCVFVLIMGRMVGVLGSEERIFMKTSFVEFDIVWNSV
jgi:hypothetical protein